MKTVQAYFPLKWNWVMLLGLFLGLVIYVFNVIGFTFNYFPGDLGDGRLNLYFLEHAHQFFTGKLSSFWNANFMFPEKNMISYSDNLLGSAPIYSLYRLLTFDTYTAYQLWFLTISALNYITAFYFLKHVFKDNYTAALGAFIFAFSIALQSQLTHAQTFPRFAIPLAFLMAVKFSETLKPSYFFLALLFLVYQIYCGIYLGFMLAIPLSIFLLIVLLKQLYIDNNKILQWKKVALMLISVVINILILLPLMLPYMDREIPPDPEHYKRIFNTLPSIKSYLYSQEGSLFWDFLSNTGKDKPAWWDHQIFVGLIATVAFTASILLFFYLLLKKSSLQRALTTPYLLVFTGLLTLIFYLRIHDFSAYQVIYYLPGFSSMRSLTRIINVELLFFALATSLIFYELCKNYSKYILIWFLFAFTIIVADNYFFASKTYRTTTEIAIQRTNKIDSIFAKIPKGSIVSYEPSTMNSNSIYYQLDAMFLAQKYGLKSINGYTATSPGDYTMYWQEPNEKTRNYWLVTKNFRGDTLYVVNDAETLEVVSLIETKELNKKIVRQEKLENLIKYIKTDAEWLIQITIKAAERNISIDSMIVLDATWVIDNENQ